MDAIQELNKLAAAVSATSRSIDLDRLSDPSWRMNVPRGAHDGSLDDAIGAVIEGLPEAEGRSVLNRIFQTRLTASARSLLLSFASRMSESAVHNEDPKLVVRGLKALAAEGGITDLRDTLVVLAKLYHSAERLAMPVNELFSEIARLSVSAELSAEMRSFPSRPAEERTLEAFGLRVVEGPHGFAYQQRW